MVSIDKPFKTTPPLKTIKPNNITCLGYMSWKHIIDLSFKPFKNGLMVWGGGVYGSNNGLAKLNGFIGQTIKPFKNGLMVWGRGCEGPMK